MSLQLDYVMNILNAVTATPFFILILDLYAKCFIFLLKNDDFYSKIIRFSYLAYALIVTNHNYEQKKSPLLSSQDFSEVVKLLSSNTSLKTANDSRLRLL